MVSYYAKQIEQYPIISIEDGFDQDDWVGFQTLLTAVKGRNVQLVGWVILIFLNLKKCFWCLVMIWQWQMLNEFN